MIRLYDARSDEPIGTITPAQLQFLAAQLEEENLEDQDYYINRTTLDFFRKEGADAGLLSLLEEALGERDEMEIRWAEE